MDPEIVDRFFAIETKIKSVLDAATSNQKAVSDVQTAFSQLQKRRRPAAPLYIPDWLSQPW